MKTLFSLSILCILFNFSFGQHHYNEYQIDLTKDKEFDITGLKLSSDSNKVNVLSNTTYYHFIEKDGYLTFEVPAEYSADKHIITVFDYNGDGNNDLIITYSNSILWRENKGDNSFGRPNKITKSKFFNRLIPISNSVFYTKKENKIFLIKLNNNKTITKRKVKDNNLWMTNIRTVNYDSTLNQINVNVRIGKGHFNFEAIINLENKKLDEVIEQKQLICYDNLYNQGSFIYNSDSLLFSKNNSRKEYFICPLDSIEEEYLDIHDFNNDGLKDILNYDREFFLLTQQKDSSFIRKKIADDYDLKAYCSTDVDGDGDIDITLNSYLGLVWLENINGDFKEHIISINRYMDFYYLIDLDKDGDKDFLMKDQNEEFIHWIEMENGKFKKPKKLKFSLIKSNFYN